MNRRLHPISWTKEVVDNLLDYYAYYCACDGGKHKHEKQPGNEDATGCGTRLTVQGFQIEWDVRPNAGPGVWDYMPVCSGCIIADEGEEARKRFMEKARELTMIIGEQVKKKRTR